MRIAIESIETQWELATKNRFLRKMQSANPRRSKRLKLKEQKWRDKVDEISHFALLVENITKTAPKVGNPNPIPRTYEEAINDPVYGPEWKKAIRSEFWSLLINGSFRETHAPDGVNSVTAKWVFAVGSSTSGSTGAGDPDVLVIVLGAVDPLVWAALSQLDTYYPEVVVGAFRDVFGEVLNGGSLLYLSDQFNYRIQEGLGHALWRAV
ncbi:uncharacterized protein ATNIH1004_011707 [Aspergillus tanneri]|uniref:Uncharacterized protein n=1 Tax=Aspergillus tanneri TaxID=1220188 RepID=A0A5M9M4D0_9EURO|nr:uncharacterized protein ATNIH1004_011707 [Aspergillus tanneri]KAA8641571.1 hypothetical protein ATNIH1004_011707 [Aspergillus tanneri]